MWTTKNEFLTPAPSLPSHDLNPNLFREQKKLKGQNNHELSRLRTGLKKKGWRTTKEENTKNEEDKEHPTTETTKLKHTPWLLLEPSCSWDVCENKNEITAPPPCFLFLGPRLRYCFNLVTVSCDMLLRNALTCHNIWLKVCACENSRSIAFAHSLLWTLLDCELNPGILCITRSTAGNLTLTPPPHPPNTMRWHDQASWSPKMSEKWVRFSVPRHKHGPFSDQNDHRFMESHSIKIKRRLQIFIFLLLYVVSPLYKKVGFSFYKQ